MGREHIGHLSPARVNALAKRVLSLDEPWRSRFLGLIAEASDDGNWNGGQPSATQLARRLVDRDVYRKVDGLLRMWAGPD